MSKPAAAYCNVIHVRDGSIHENFLLVGADGPSTTKLAEAQLLEVVRRICEARGESFNMQHVLEDGFTYAAGSVCITWPQMSRVPVLAKSPSPIIPGVNAPIRNYVELRDYFNLGKRPGQGYLDELLDAQKWDRLNLSAMQIDVLADMADEYVANAVAC